MASRDIFYEVDKFKNYQLVSANKKSCLICTEIALVLQAN